MEKLIKNIRKSVAENGQYIIFNICSGDRELAEVSILEYWQNSSLSEEFDFSIHYIEKDQYGVTVRPKSPV